MSAVAQPCTRLALCLGDFAGGHLDRDFGPAGLAAGVARQRGEVEPFMRLDQVDVYSAAAGRKCDAKLVERLDASRLRFGHPAAKEEVGTLLTDRPKTTTGSCAT